MRLDRLALRPSARSARGSCGPGSAAYIGQAKAPPKRALMSVTRRPSSESRNIWMVAGPRSGSASATARPRSISSGSAIAGALDRLAAARLEHRARDRVQAAAVEVAQQVDGELRAVHEALDHHRLLDVGGEELGLARVGAGVDRARARALARLDHRREAARPPRPAATSAGSAARAARAAGARGTCRTSPGRRRRSGTNAGRSRAREHLEVEVGQRDHRGHAVLLDQLGQERDVAPGRRRAAARPARRRRTGRARAGSGRRRRRTRAARTS